MVFWHDSSGLFDGLIQEHQPSDWRLIIDSPQRSLKTLLLHNGNSEPSLPIIHSIQLKETYDKMQILLQTVRHNVHQWNICGDLKVTDMLMGRQGGCTKLCCFLCPWDSRCRAEHYIKCDCEPRKVYEPEEDSVQHTHLINPMKIFRHPLHIKLGLIKFFVKAMQKTSSKGFQCLSKKFSRH